MCRLVKHLPKFTYNVVDISKDYPCVKDINFVTEKKSLTSPQKEKTSPPQKEKMSPQVKEQEQEQEEAKQISLLALQTPGEMQKKSLFRYLLIFRVSRS